MIEIKNLSKEFVDGFGFKTPVIKNLSFTIQDEKITSIISPKGAGKTTLLKIISGLEETTSGSINKEENQKIFYVPSVSQSFPWLNVRENISFGLTKIDDNENKRLISLVGLEGYDLHHPNNKSYGFRFRISLARSLAHQPSLILLDEPFNLMDIETKEEIFSLIREVNKSEKVTMLLATSSITEALVISDKIFLMKKNPAEIFSELEIDLPVVRDESIITSEKFVLLRTKIVNSFSNLKSQMLFDISI